MNKKKDIDFKNRVLNSFKKVSPSEINIENSNKFKSYRASQKNLFFWKLNFPPKLFEDKKIIDFGCGTGEIDIILNEWGGNVEAFDFNEKSIKRANFLKNKFKIGNEKLKFYMGDIENYQFKKNYFDITMSLGVIAHVPNQKQMFKKMVQATKNDGFLILGYVEDAGLIQRLLHRSIIKVNSNESESKTFELAMKVFGEHIKRSVEFGGRSAEAIINDYLINPEYHGLSSIKLNEWAQEYGLKLYSSYPNTNIPFGIDSPYSENISRNNMIYQRYLSICRLRFIFAQLTDDEVFSKFFKNLDNLSQKIEESIKTLNHILQNFDFTYENLEKQREQWKKVTEDYKKYAELKVIETHEELIVMVDELLRVLELISDKNNKNKSFLLKKITKRLFKGYNGLATSYTIWHKSV